VALAFYVPVTVPAFHFARRVITARRPALAHVAVRNYACTFQAPTALLYEPAAVHSLGKLPQDPRAIRQTGLRLAGRCFNWNIPAWHQRYNGRHFEHGDCCRKQLVGAVNDL